MALFAYTARSKDGKKTCGTVEAQDKRDAVDRIGRLGSFPVSVELQAGQQMGNTKEQQAKAVIVDRLKQSKPRAPAHTRDKNGQRSELGWRATAAVILMFICCPWLAGSLILWSVLATQSPNKFMPDGLINPPNY